MKPRKYTHKDGTVTYKLNKKLHREDGPAYEYPHGKKKAWYINGMLHRENGPAIEHPNGYKSWYVNGVYHRLDGPAIEWGNGNKSWYVNDIEYNTELEYWLAVQQYTQ